MNWNTHEITNAVEELTDYNVYSTDVALREAVHRSGGQAFDAELADYGALLGSASTLRMADAANRFAPTLRAYDRMGRRVDEVEFHPAWHGIMKIMREQGLVAMPFADPRPGRWSAYAAGFSMHGQIEAGSQCPASMTFACIPVLQKESALFAKLAAGLYSKQYDERDLPIEHKRSLLIGMGMTEKQGGSDVRSNTTRATPISGGEGGRGSEYLLVGHKWFMSAPTSDAHLVLARTDGGLSCFYVPRYRPDGSKNAVRIQRLKEKVGNRSNASSEVEFEDAWGLMIGEEGRGIPTIIEMATHTRLNCVMGSTGLIRQAVVQAINYANQRMAFGKHLSEQPLMRNVLADMALESEAATQLMMRLTDAFASAEDSLLARAYKRIVTPAAKFWIAKRGIELAAEALEVFGGNGYIEDGPVARLYREMPVISIWEGSGNIMALDMLRAMAREPDALVALVDDLATKLIDDARLRPQLDALLNIARTPADELEARARHHAQRLILLIQAALLREHSPAEVADAFIASRFDSQCGRVYGTLQDHTTHASIIRRAWQQ
jgi:putative acyl-CoA dehydrogenase